MPNANAAAQRACTASSSIFTCDKRCRALSTSSAVHSGPSSFSSCAFMSKRNARRSASPAGICSSSLEPSSRATKPMLALAEVSKPSLCKATMPVSSTLPKRAAADKLMRSAMAKINTPPSACANKPRRAMGFPACSVAPRSSPPSRAVSLMFRGTRRRGVCAGKRFFKSASHWSRFSQAGERSATPPKPTGSTAKSAAMVAASPCMGGMDLLSWCVVGSGFWRRELGQRSFNAA